MDPGRHNYRFREQRADHLRHGRGRDGCVTKPFDAGECRTAARSIEVRRLSKELERLRIRPANFREGG